MTIDTENYLTFDFALNVYIFSNITVNDRKNIKTTD